MHGDVARQVRYGVDVDAIIKSEPPTTDDELQRFLGGGGRAGVWGWGGAGVRGCVMHAAGSVWCVWWIETRGDDPCGILVYWSPLERRREE